jgi:trimeric autotransporter adhesin
MTHVGARNEPSAPQVKRRGRHIARLWHRRFLPFYGVAAVTVLVFGSVQLLAVLTQEPVAVQPGASPLGTISYPAPKAAIFVSVDGSDAAKGTKAEPLETVQRAIAVARSGQTIVVRGGTYNQRATVTKDKTVTIQPYHKEIVWFDGSVVVSNWKQEGNLWVSKGWTTQFDSSPTFESGAPENTEPGFTFVNPDYPLAAHPDQVWIDAMAQTQVATSADVTTGTFAVDQAASRIYLGSDPTGHEVRSSNKTKAFGIQSKNTVLRGIGVRDYGTSVSGFGAVSVEAPGVRISNVVIKDNATTGLFIGAANATVSQVTISDNGMLGIGANYADNLRVSGVVSVGNNTQHFNSAPVSGGFKITRSRTVTIEYSQFSNNLGPGMWFDESVFDGNILSNSISDNEGHGLILEISDHFVVAGNTVSNNEKNGIKVNNTSDVQIWNNTVVGNGRDLSIVQDQRRSSDKAIPGHDPRQTSSDPKMTWIVGAVTASNNVFSGTTSNCVVCIEDFSSMYSAEELGVTLNGNAYQRESPDSADWLVVWSGPDGKPLTYTTLDDFVGATRQERRGVELGNAGHEAKTWLTEGADEGAAGASVLILPQSIRDLLGWGLLVNRMGAKE